jgi:tight adherence protein C
METLAVPAAAAVLVAGAAMVAFAVRSSRRAVADPGEYLRSLDDQEPHDEFEELLAQPFLSRVVRPLGAKALRSIGGLTPSHHLERIHKQLVLGGVSHSVRAEEVVAAQVVAGAVGLLLAMAWVVFGDPSARLGALSLVLLPLVGVMAPQSWVRRKVDDRKDAIRRDLPDTLDLMAISVEAGTGLEGAMQVVCQHFTSPLAQELSRTLKEMELGLSRREALHNLKRRTEVPELSNFVLTLTQADALGMPIGRVLKVQAAEMRLRRRQWAREKAGKLPVKILFPLVLFIFPALFVVILGPAAAEIGKAF